jgi:flagellar export protein FliJ
MDSKFKAIAKVRKQQMDKVETKLVKARFEKKSIEKKLKSLYEDIHNSTPPQKGTASIMALFHENLKVLRREKSDYADLLAHVNEKLLQLQNEYKKAHIEFEKIKYLEEQEYVAWLEKIKKQERIDMDEISSMLFSNAKGN